MNNQILQLNLQRGLNTWLRLPLINPLSYAGQKGKHWCKNRTSKNAPKQLHSCYHERGVTNCPTMERKGKRKTPAGEVQLAGCRKDGKHLIKYSMDQRNLGNRLVFDREQDGWWIYDYVFHGTWRYPIWSRIWT